MCRKVQIIPYLFFEEFYRMNKSDKVPMMYEMFPAVTALNQVQGFNPLKMLRRIVSPKTGEEVLRLDLQYKKLWFRLRHPEGRIRINPLRITEQLAIYEAQVYLNRDDPAPVCSFTSSISKEEAPDGKYIQAAQDDAVDNALTDAGFGIQLSDVSTPESMRHFGSEIPVSKLGNPGAVNSEQARPVQKPVVQAPSAPEQPATPVRQSHAFKTMERPVQAVQNAAPKQTASVHTHVQNAAPEQQVQPKYSVPIQEQKQPAQNVHAAHAALEVLHSSGPAYTAQADEQDLPFTFGTSYNNEMSPDEIVKVMTLEQARAVVVDSGMCKGMTMGEVAEKRPVNLKFYLFGGYRGNNNILKAAAQIMFDQLPKAS